METVKRNCMRVWGQYCCRRRQLEDGYGSYNMLSNNTKTSKVVPQGFFCVYVGPEKQRFLIKIELANHPLFQMLLEHAANEYGLRNDGPICLPCDADFFCEALAEMDTLADSVFSEL